MNSAINHQRFLSHLSKSNEARDVVVDYLLNKGHEVTLPPLTMAKSHSEWKKHADSGDLFIKQRIEVKRISKNFTCKTDWPFGGDFIVCAKHSFDLAKPKPFAYFILSNSTPHFALVLGSSSGAWRAASRQDGRYENYSQEFYFCPIDLVTFGTFSPCP